MTRHTRWTLVGLTLSTGALLGAVLIAGMTARAQQAPHGAPEPRGGHGTPAGWGLAWPKGDAGKGRAIFERFECYGCHEVKGESFPAASNRESVGPELSQMGPLHDTEYFVESIVNPSATIEASKGYAAPDGSSKMPSFNDSMLVQELIDLVAYLRALKPPAGAPGGHGGSPGGHGGGSPRH